MIAKAQLRYIGSAILKDLSVRIGKNKSRILPMVVSVASSEWKLAGSTVDYEDVVAEALLGLVKADSSFKKSYGAKFSTYAHIRIRGAAKDAIRREIVNRKKHILVDSQVFSSIAVESRVEAVIALREQFKTAIEVLRKELSPAHSDLLVKFYLQERSETDIAKELKCSSVKVSKEKKKALTAAKEAMKKRGHHAVV
jgi:RNA polymerase sigma factor (sigma-70 family)